MTSDSPVITPPPAPPPSLLKKVVAVVGASWLIFGGGVLAVAGTGALMVHLATPVLTPTIPPMSETRAVVTPTPDVILAVRSLGRLETESYHLERVVDLADHQTRLFGLVKSRDAILLLAVGDVVAGIDLEQVTPGDVDTDWERRTVTLHLPPPSVFSAKLDEKATRVYARTTDFVAVRHEDLESRARAEAVRSMEAAAVEHGLLDRARGDTERALTGLLKSVGFSEVRVAWKKS